MPEIMWRILGMKRKLIAVFLMLIMLCTCLVGCGGNSASPKDKYGIISSSEAEVEQIKKIMKVEDEKEVSEMTFYLGTIKGENVVLVKNELGKVNAALATQILLDKFGVTKIIGADCFTSLKDDYEEGSLVVARDTIQSDFDASGAGYAVAEIPDTGLGAFATDVDLHKSALDIIKKEASGATVYEVSICSGDKYELSKAEIDKIVEDHDGDVYDMDSAAIGQVCYLSGTPYIIIGTISGPETPNENVAKIVQKLVEVE